MSPARCLCGCATCRCSHWSLTARLQHRLDQIDIAYLAVFYLLAAAVFWFRYRTEPQPLQRQQLKWLSRGTLLTVVPFTALYVMPFLADWTVPSVLGKVAVLSLLLLPLTFSWAIVRFRLMDVDLIFKRGVAYTLATAALVGLYFGVVALSAEVVHTRLAAPRRVGPDRRRDRHRPCLRSTQARHSGPGRPAFSTRNASTTAKR